MLSLISFILRFFQVRRVLVFTAHVVLFAVSYFGAFYIRFDFSLPETYRQFLWVGLFLVVAFRAAAGMVFGLYGSVLKYAGITDLVDILKAMTMATFAFVVMTVLLGFRDLPRSVFVIDWLGSIVLIGGLRFALRTIRETFFSGLQADRDGRKRVIILGAGDAGEALVRELHRVYRDRYEVVGFLDDNPSKQGLRIHDVKVLGPIYYLAEYVQRYGIDEVIIAIPSAGGSTIREIVNICKIANVLPKTIPGVDQLIDGKLAVSQIRSVAIEDLLGRDPVQLEEGLIREFLYQKNVMVTGAGGSIGAELCRQIVRYHPRAILLVEQSEPNLFAIHQELQVGLPDGAVVPLIADVTDTERMKRVFLDHAPEVIFHAAAHKHVPMMEWNPGEAVKNNVFGTLTVADLADRYGALALVLISTDKAVNPSSVMGATKRMAEMYIQALSCNSKTKFTAVRFGNVLGSVGSVIPIFRSQIEKGGPVTVTDPEMRRYFMTIPESCQLVMQAAAMGEGGEIFVLDMGEPVKISDLAQDLITLSGFEPGKDIEIVYTGCRPGEKLFEELGFNEEKMSKTRHPKIYIGKLLPYPLEEIQKHMEMLHRVIDWATEEGVKGVLNSIVPEFESNASIPVDKVFTSTNPACGSKEAPSRRVLACQTGVDDVGNASLADRERTPKSSEGISPALFEAAKTRNGLDKQIDSQIDRPVLINRDALTEDETSTEAEREENPAFDETWNKYVEMCRQSGFMGAGWITMGVKPSDIREVYFAQEEEQPRRVVRRSIPISSLAFLELRFYCPHQPKKKASSQFRLAVREISTKMSVDVVRLSRHI